MPKIKIPWKMMGGGCYDKTQHYCDKCGAVGTLDSQSSAGSWWGPFGNFKVWTKCSKCGNVTKETGNDGFT